MTPPLISRLPAWEEILAVFLDRVSDSPFAWGAHDCALFAADAVRAMTGHDFAAAFRGRYTDARGAALALRAFGAGTLAKTVGAALGAPLHPARARRGDVVEFRKSLGIYVAGVQPGAWFVDDGRMDAPAAGLVWIPHPFLTRAWAVPF